MPTDTAPTPITGADTHSDPAPPPAPPDSLESRLAQVQAELAESRRILDKARRDRDVQRALHESGAIDVDAAAALLADTTADAPAAVADLRARKPHLFRAAAPAAPAVRPATSAMSAAPADPRPGLSRAAERAASTGDRGALMTYLRLRRAGA